MRSLSEGSWDSSLRAISLAAAAMLLPTGGKAFTQPNHEGITTGGLTDQVVAVQMQGRLVRFSDRAVEKIRKANSDVDDDTYAGLRPNTAHLHFDDNTLVEGSLAVVKLRSQLVARMRELDATQWEAYVNQFGKADGASRVDDARELFGKLLHTVQDFYAHSTWIDNGNSGPGDFAWGISAISTPPPTTGGCRDGYDALGPLVSEYFSIFRSIQVAQVSLSQCIHGPGRFPACSGATGSDTQYCFVELDFIAADGALRNGINKDSGPRKGFVKARDSAIEATKRVALSVIYELTAHSPYAACAFVADIDQCQDAIVFQLASGGYSTINPYNTSAGAVVTPKSIKVKSSNPNVGVRDQNLVTPIMQNIDGVQSRPTLLAYTPRICRVKGQWVPMTYAWKTEYDAPYTNGCEGSTGQKFSGSVDISIGGDLRVVIDKLTYAHQKCPGSQSFSDSAATVNQVHRVNLLTGAGGGDYSAHYKTFNGQVTTESVASLAEWPAEDQVPPLLPGLFLTLIQRYPLNQLPPECGG